MSDLRAYNQFKNRDFLETPEGFLFCVVGEIHPKDVVAAYPKYIPGSGPWRFQNRRYKRVMKVYSMVSLREALNLVRTYPVYRRKFEAWDVTMSCVPTYRIVRHFKPEERLRQIEKLGARDQLEQKLLELVDLISEGAGISKRFIGVTGSILLRIHNPKFSDIDLTVYGAEEATKIRETILTLKTNSILSSLPSDHIDKSVKEKLRYYPLGYNELKKFYNRIWQRGLFKGTAFSIHPERKAVTERYGDKLYKNTGLARVKAEIIDDSEGLFLPATYRIKIIDWIEGHIRKDVEELTSFDGFLSSTLKVGDRIEVKAKLEEVYDKRRSKVYSRLTIGTLEYAAIEYVKLLD